MRVSRPYLRNRVARVITRCERRSAYAGNDRRASLQVKAMSDILTCSDQHRKRFTRFTCFTRRPRSQSIASDLRKHTSLSLFASDYAPHRERGRQSVTMDA